MKILVIEDERLLAQSIKAVLEQKGFEVESVYDGETGAEYARLGIYDLVILDVMLPGLDGFQVAQALRASRCNTPILMLTARSGIDDRIQGLNAGADYYLTKPFDTRELLAVTLGVTVFIYAVGSAADWLLSKLMTLTGFDRLLKKYDTLL